VKNGPSSSTRTVGHARATTMKDIARALGLSQSTVSRVLSGAPSVVPIAAETRERVLGEARRRAYRPHPLASGLRGARTRLLGAIMGEILGPFAAGAMDAITAEANALGYNTVLGNAHGQADEAMAIRTVLETRHCDAILLIGDTREQPRLLEDLRKTALPLVALWQGEALDGISTVNVDNRLGATCVLEHLGGLGHRQVGFVGIANRQGDINQRKLAYRAFMSKIGEEVPDGFIEEVVHHPAGGAEAAHRMLRLPERPTAIFCASDVLAIGALHAAQNLGLRVPGDVSIVGFDDISFAAYTVPALTTIHMPMAEMVRLAVQEALRPDVGDAVKNFSLLPALVIRQSSGRVPAQRRAPAAHRSIGSSRPGLSR